MNTKKILFALAVSCFILTGCKNADKKVEVKKEVLAVNTQKVSLAISGMTCEIGCAKTIQSKLSKKEGVLNAKVVFIDSIANIEFDSNTTSKKELISFVNGIAGGDLYTASETSTISKKAHTCSESCKKKCEMMDTKTECKKDCKMACCAEKV